MRVRLLTFPQPVALHCGGRWVSPFEFESYIVAQADWRGLAFMVSLMSFCRYTLAALVLDVLLAWLRGHACGDVSGLWALARLPTSMLVVALLAVRVFLLWYAAE